jgi:hypothetical protein
MGADPLTLARRYRARRPAAAPVPAALVGALSQRYRARRWHRLEGIIARVNALPAEGEAPDVRAAEALDYATAGHPKTPRDTEVNVRWRAACFDVLVRDALNAGDRIADLRLRPGQRAVLVPIEQGTTLGVTASPSAPWTNQQQRALDDLARVRDTIASEATVRPAINMAPLPEGVEWRELVGQLAARRSWRSAPRSPSEPTPIRR